MEEKFDLTAQFWKSKFPSFHVHSEFHGGKQGTGCNKNKIYNKFRIITIEKLPYLEVQTQKPEITFLCDLYNFCKLCLSIWYSYKHRNTYYIATCKNKKNIELHKLIKSEYKIIDHIN